MTEVTADALMPQDPAAEQALLGAILIDNALIDEVGQRLKQSDFYRPAHGWIYDAMLRLKERGQPIDYLTVVDQLARTKQELDGLRPFKRALQPDWEAIGIEYLADVTERVPTSANGTWYATQVKTKAILREIIAAGKEVTSDAFDFAGDLSEFLDGIERKVFAITQRDVGTSGLVTVRQALTEVFERLERAHENAGLSGGLLTPYTELNHLTGGLHGGEMVIVAARPSMGKTSWGLSLANELSIVGDRPGAIMSKEMLKAQLTQNLLCAVAGIDSKRLRTGYVDEYEYDRLHNAAGRIASAPLYIDDSPVMTARNICATLRRARAQKGIEYAIVDYLQLLDRPAGRGDGRSREQEVASDSRALKALARELEIPIIVLAQLNRDVEKRAGSHRPRMSDLRESGSVEQDADAIFLLHREFYYTRNPEDATKAELIVAKQRNGPTGTAQMVFRGEYMRFDDFDPLAAAEAAPAIASLDPPPAPAAALFDDPEESGDGLAPFEHGR